MSDAVPLRVAVVGLGPLGVAVAEAVTRDGRFRLAALVGPASSVRSMPLSDLGVPISADVDTLDAIDVAVVCGGPHLDRLAPTLRQLMHRTIHVVSNCEEMAWPWLRHPHLADMLGGEARRAGVALVGTGGDAGLTLLAAPLALALTLADVRRVHVRRVIDAGGRDPAGQRALGAGVPLAQFRELLKAERIGRVGVGEAVVLVAQALGCHPMRGDIAVRVEPVRSEGDAAMRGLRSVGTFAGGGVDVTVDLTIATGVTDAGDRIEIDADRTLAATITPDPAGHAGLVSGLLGAAHAVSRLSPGLKTMLDLPPLS